MYFRFLVLSFGLSVRAARPFLNEPDTGFNSFLPENGTLPPLEDIKYLPDFDAAARNYMGDNYTYYRNGAGGEWSYNHNLEIFDHLRFSPRRMVDVTGVKNSLQTSILGYNYSVPFFIAPAARAGYANPEGERSLMRAAKAANVLYAPSFLSTVPLEEIAAVRGLNSNYTSFQQLYIENNDTEVEERIRAIERAQHKAIFLTVDSAGDGVRPRAARYNMTSADTELTLLTWERFTKIQAMTSLPIIPKGILSVGDARRAVEAGAQAIYLSNHGGRQLDYSPSAVEVAMAINEEAPEIFGQVEVLADGGVRHGTDVLKLLAPGVKAVGLARPFMYANCYADEGVSHAIDLLRSELVNDAANLGVADIQRMDTSFLEGRKKYQFLHS